MNGKADVRKKIRARLTFDAPERARRSAALCEMIRQDMAWACAHTIALFAPQGTEPDVELLWAVASKSFCYPRVGDGALDFLRVIDRFALAVGRWNIREPAFAAADLVAPEEIDLILIPGVAFTLKGERLGRGGGYYDRFLARVGLRAVKLGICFKEQLLEDLPIESHDARVDRVLAG